MCVVPNCSHATTVSAYPVDCDCLCHLMDTHYCSLCLNGSLNLPSASHPPPPHTHPLIGAICDITVAVKKVAQNPAELATIAGRKVIEH